MTAVCATADAVLTPHRREPVGTGVVRSAALASAYALWLFVVRVLDGQWVYPVMAVRGRRSSGPGISVRK